MSIPSQIREPVLNLSIVCPDLFLSVGVCSGGGVSYGEGPEGVEGEGVLPHPPHPHLTLLLLLLPALRPVLLTLQLHKRDEC
jgi:hypothetical protein